MQDGVKEGILLGKQMFDIAEYAPKLDEEPYASDPNKKLSLPLKLSLTNSASEASLDIQLVFDNQNKTAPKQQAAPANVRDTMMMAMLGKYASANQAAKE